MNLNEHKIQLSGRANIMDAIDLGSNADIVIKNADVRKSEMRDNDDGSYDQIYHIKISELSEVVIVCNGKTVKNKEKKSQSQALRMAIRDLWKRSGEPGDSEDFYKEKMSLLIDWVNNK